VEQAKATRHSLATPAAVPRRTQGGQQSRITNPTAGAATAMGHPMAGAITRAEGTPGEAIRAVATGAAVMAAAAEDTRRTN